MTVFRMQSGIIADIVVEFMTLVYASYIRQAPVYTGEVQ